MASFDTDYLYIYINVWIVQNNMLQDYINSLSSIAYKLIANLVLRSSWAIGSYTTWALVV